MRQLLYILMILCMHVVGNAQAQQNDVSDDVDLTMDISVGGSNIGTAFNLGIGMQFDRIVITPNYIGSRSGATFDIFPGSYTKFNSLGLLLGWSFPADPEQEMVVPSIGISLNIYSTYASTGIFGLSSEKTSTESIAAFPIHIKFYIPTKSAVGLYLSARYEFNSLNDYYALTVGLRFGRIGFFESKGMKKTTVN